MTALRVVRAMTDQNPTVDETLSNLRGAVLVVETGVVNGLPTPAQISIDRDLVSLTVTTADEMASWMGWLEAEDVEQYSHGGGVTLHTAETMLMGVPVRLMRVTFDDQPPQL